MTEQPTSPDASPPGKPSYDAVLPLDLDSTEGGTPRMVSRIAELMTVSPEQWEAARLADWGTLLPVDHMDEDGWENDILQLSLANVVIQLKPLVELGDDRGWVCQLHSYSGVQGEELPV